jgi:hypothetical protein
MILLSRRFHFKVGNSHGQINMNLPLWSDRVLCTMELEDLFLDCLLQSLATNDSDQCPLLLGLKDNYSGTRHFHFETFWPKLEGFQKAVASSWNLVPAASCPFPTLDMKIKAITRMLGMSVFNLHSLKKFDTRWKLLMTVVISREGKFGLGTI